MFFSHQLIEASNMDDNNNILSKHILSFNNAISFFSQYLFTNAYFLSNSKLWAVKKKKSYGWYSGKKKKKWLLVHVKSCPPITVNNLSICQICFDEHIVLNYFYSFTHFRYHMFTLGFVTNFEPRYVWLVQNLMLPNEGKQLTHSCLISCLHLLRLIYYAKFWYYSANS